MIVAVANRKGGTGKTTTAVNLAAEWAAQGHSTLLVDLDTQGHAALGVGCARQLRPGRGVHQVFREPSAALEPLLIETPCEGLTLLPADPDYSGDGGEQDPLRLWRALAGAGLMERFSRIVLDTPPTLGAVLINALATARGVLAPFVPHHLAGVAVRQLARLFFRVATGDNPGLRHFALLPVMIDPRLKLHRRVVEGLGRQFGERRLLRGIRTSIRLAEAFEQGRPIRDFAPRSSGAMDYCLLAAELDAQWAENTTTRHEGR